MKNRVLLIFSILIINFLYSEDFDGLTFVDNTFKPILQKSISFNNGELEYKIDNDGEIDKWTEPYRIDRSSGLTYILIGKNSKKWLCLFSDSYIIMYDSDSKPFFLGNNIEKNYLSDSLSFGEKYFRSTSYLSEETKKGKIEYSSTNLGINSLPSPWVEGVPGNGIGEKIYIDVKKTEDYSEKYIVLSNGYVSYSRSDLFRKNNRIKKIRLQDIESGNYRDINIKDTSDFCIIPLYDIIRSDGVIIEILDVYPGTQYNDTCINFIGIGKIEIDRYKG
ncbi:NADase-type glycan-binding domain-containing protein [Spirochaeta cellobiosiphila]|uniref:NADase-type glycan-binding domain-containing protein n=1 Tax=Spirochaeta cellobiosiphila TaxID=504483 RepID=UPI00040320B5|nr:hypothetical protein [Spirochaeta cellobiosiphila]